MTRILVAFWLLFSLCAVSCTTKKTEDQPPNQEIANSSVSAAETLESSQTVADSVAAVMPEMASTPDPAPVDPTPEVAETRKAKPVATPKAVARTSPKRIVSSPVAPELSAAVEPSAPAYRPRSYRASGFLCDTIEFVKYEKLHDGEGGFIRGKVISQKSRQCGYVAAVVRKESSTPTPVQVLTPVASQPLMSPVEQWVADALLPEKCEDGTLYRYEKNTQSGIGRKTKVGTCPVELAKPDYLNKTIQQVKDDGLIKKGESGTRKKDN